MDTKKLLEFKDPSGTIIKYDSDMFKIKRAYLSNNKSISYLHFEDDYEGSISLPEGLTLTFGMFAHCHIKPGCYFENFDTSNVIDMSRMFENCEMSDGFTLGDKFDTSNVKNMEFMFDCCNMADGFTLGNKFNTSNVKNMNNMFRNCNMSDGFTLGDKFDTSNVKHMRQMFWGCNIPDSFTLGDKFDMSNVEYTNNMFLGCYKSDGSKVRSVDDLKPDVKKSESKKSTTLDTLKREKDKMDRDDFESERSDDKDITDK